MATVVLLAGATACSSEGDDTGFDDDVVDEFCAGAQRSLDAAVESGDAATSPEFEAVSEALASLEPPAAIADQFRLVLSGDDGIQSGAIVDEEQFVAYEAANDAIAVFLVDECGIDADLVNGTN